MYIISQYAFYNNNITEIRINEGLTTIGQNAFSGLGPLETIYLPTSIDTISANAFPDCSSLTDVYYAGTKAQGEEILIGTGNTYLSSATWHFNSESGSGEIPSDQTCGANLTWSLSGNGILTISGTGEMTNYTESSLPWVSFANQIYAVVVSDGTTSIGNYAFSNCNNILYLNIPTSVKNIGSNAFDGCSKLAVVNYSGTEAQKSLITIGANNSSFSSADWYYASDNTVGMGATSGSCGRNTVWALGTDGTMTISGTGAMNNYTSDGGKPWEARKSSIKAVVVESGVTSVGEYAFEGCPNLASITLPEGLKTIGQNAFNNCDKLKNLTVPAGVVLGTSAFSGCDALTTINLGSEVRIGNYAFSQCSSLANVALAEGIQSIGSYAFYNCDRLGSISIPESMESIGENAFRHCDMLTDVTIQEGLEIIGAGAFASCYQLDGIVLPNSLTMLGTNAFGKNGYDEYPYNRGCVNLSTIVLSEALESIPSNCFDQSGLTEINIPEGVTTIGASAFNTNASLTTVALPSTMEEIASGAFSGCSSLTDVYYAGTQAQAEEILIGTNNTYLSSATWHCTGNTEPPEPPQPDPILTLPSFLTTIESEAFSGVAAKEIIIPDSVDVIESYAFANCNNLEMSYFEGSPFSSSSDILGGRTDVVISVLKGSSAEKWAKRLGLTIVYHQ